MAFQPLDAEQLSPDGLFGIGNEKILTQWLRRESPPLIRPLHMARPGECSR
jgi:hypothetical protein